VVLDLADPVPLGVGVQPGIEGGGVEPIDLGAGERGSPGQVDGRRIGFVDAARLVGEMMQNRAISRGSASFRRWPEFAIR